MQQLIGQKFGRWLILQKTTLLNKSKAFLCKCDCGTERIVSWYTLKSGKSASCGCSKKTINGLSCTRIRRIYQGMVDRCYRKTNGSYSRYGAVGISVCERWRISFNNFYEDMGDPPSPKHTLDRIAGAIVYSKETCRWATYSEQARNRKSNHLIDIGGIVKCAYEWAEIYGVVGGGIFLKRISDGWEVEKALLTPKIIKTKR